MIRHSVLLIVVIALLSFAEAAIGNAPDTWLAGQQAFQRGDYVEALRLFKAAQRSGVEGPALSYNIAVCHYKLGDYEQSRLHFRRIADQYPKMRGLVEYNLGLVAQQLGDNMGARQHFVDAYRLSTNNETLRILSSRMLGQIEPEVVTASRWTGAFGLRIGNDDNVALRDELGLPSGVSAQSPMIDLFGSVQGPIDVGTGFQVNGSVYLIRYSDASEFNQSEIRGGVVYDWRPNDLHIAIGAHASASTLGGDSFDQKTGAEARIARFFGRSNSIGIRLVYDDITASDSQVAGIKGSRLKIAALYRWYSNSHQFLVRYSFETNHRSNPSVSPDRHRVGVTYRYDSSAGLGYEAGFDVRRGDYNDLAIPRDEELLTARVGVTYSLANSWHVWLEYRYSENRSSDPVFSYDRNQITLGFLKSY